MNVTAAERETLSIVLHPLQGDDESLSVSSFITSVEALRKTAAKFHCKELKIKKLSSNSPISMTVEDAAPESCALSILLRGLNEFTNNGEIPESWSRPVIDSVLEFLSPIGKTIGRVSLSSNADKAQEIVLDVKYKVAFQSKIMTDFAAYGTIDGMLEAVNIHGKKNVLTLYPSIGHDKVSCDFPNEFLSQVKNLIGSYVEINGEMNYRWRDKYPHGGMVEKIERIDEDSLPSFSSLYGLAPNATKGIPAEKFIAGIRNEWK
jgi:hypothetical protein